MSTDTSQFDGNAYLARVAEYDARYLTETLELINARDNADIADVLTRITPLGGPVDPRNPHLMAAALGALSYRAQTIIERLRRAEARVAELEAERDACCPSCDGSRCPGA